MIDNESFCCGHRIFCVHRVATTDPFLPSVVAPSSKPPGADDNTDPPVLGGFPLLAPNRGGGGAAEFALLSGVLAANLSSKGLMHAHALKIAAVLTGALPPAPLVVLNLASNFLRDDGAAAIGSVLAVEGCALQHLCLDDNLLGDRAAGSLAAALRANKALRALSLCHNGIGDCGARALMVAHQANRASALVALYITFNAVSPNAARALQASLESRVPPAPVPGHGKKKKGGGGGEKKKEKKKKKKKEKEKGKGKGKGKKGKKGKKKK